MFSFAYGGVHLRLTTMAETQHAAFSHSALLYSDHSDQNRRWVLRHWQMQEAKAKLSEVIRDAEHEGPGEITLDGKPVGVVLSREHYERLTGTGESLVAFMCRSPLHGVEEVDLERDNSLTREVEL